VIGGTPSNCPRLCSTNLRKHSAITTTGQRRSWCPGIVRESEESHCHGTNVRGSRRQSQRPCTTAPAHPRRGPRCHSGNRCHGPIGSHRASGRQHDSPQERKERVLSDDRNRLWEQSQDLHVEHDDYEYVFGRGQWKCKVRHDDNGQYHHNQHHCADNHYDKASYNVGWHVPLERDPSIRRSGSPRPSPYPRNSMDRASPMPTRYDTHSRC